MKLLRYLFFLKFGEFGRNSKIKKRFIYNTKIYYTICMSNYIEGLEVVSKRKF